MAIKEIRDKNKFELFNNRWKSLTDGRPLEVKWTKSDGLGEEEEVLEATTSLERFGIHPEKLSTTDVDFRDENDEMLDGVDDDLLDSLT